MKKIISIVLIVFCVSGLQAQYLDLNEYGIKGDNTNESGIFTQALLEAASKGLTVRGKGVIELYGARIIIPGNVKIQSASLGDLVIRNGAFIFAQGDIQVKNVVFEDFKTAVFYYPKGKEPKGKISIQSEHCLYRNNVSAFSSQGQSRELLLINSYFKENEFINVTHSAVNLKFPHEGLNFHQNKFEGVQLEGKKLAYLVLVGMDSTGGGTGFRFTENKIRDIVHPGSDVNYTVLARGSRSYIADNLVEEISDVAFYVRGDSGVVERNRIFNKNQSSEYAIIAKGGTTKGYVWIMNNVIKGKFGTAVYLDCKYGSAKINDNDIDINFDEDTVLFAGIRVIGNNKMDRFDISGNSIKVDMKNPRAAAIRLNGKGFEQVNITNNKMLESSSRILLTGKNDIRNLKMTGNRMKSRSASTIAADNVEIDDNEVDYPESFEKAFKVNGNRKSVIGNRKMKQ